MDKDPQNPTTKVVIIFYSLYTHTSQLAQAIFKGASEIEGVEVEMYQVPELLTEDVINKMGATQPKERMKNIPVITSEIRKEVIKSADAIIFGSPTRFGVMTAQMKSFFDNLGGLWFENACVGKVASVFTGTGCQHGGQEMTLFSMITPLLHLGFIVVGLPYSCTAQKEMHEISGGSPYGSTFIAGSDGSRAVSDNEKECGRFQGRHVAQIAKELKYGRLRLGAGPSASTTTTTSTSTTTEEKPAENNHAKEGKDKEPAKESDKEAAAEEPEKEPKKADKEPAKKVNKTKKADKGGKKSGKDSTRKASTKTKDEAPKKGKKEKKEKTSTKEKKGKN